VNQDSEDSVWDRVEPLLLRVERPSRYLGGEYNAPRGGIADVTVALAYPDVYEIGSSNLGVAILQEVVNDIEGAACERVYSPWVDMESEMRAAGVPLFTLETHRPVAGFDVFGISMPHELTYTNILNLIDLAGLPLRASERTGGPLVIGGGCGAANPEPLAEFFDLFILGEAEESIGSLVELVSRAKTEGLSRREILARCSGLRGFYVPSLYDVEYGEDGLISAIAHAQGAQARVRKAVVDLDRWTHPHRPIVPFCEAVHDRLNVELFRGCTRGCRFCQAGMINRPVRERSGPEVVRLVEELSAATGYDEVSLCSLSSTDYTMIETVAKRVGLICGDRGMVLSLPSLRMDGFSVELALELDGGGRGGLTFAPEAATDRLRMVINKHMTEKDMTDAVTRAVRAGRRRMKLYFMIGLPTETDADVEEIPRLVYRLRNSVRAEGMPPPSFNVSVSTFVPKPHTPFQWAAQDSIEAIERKQDILKSGLRSKGVKLSWHDRYMSTIEGLLARGDRRLSAVLREAWAAGARFDSWSEHFDSTRWLEACSRASVDPAFYVHRERAEDEILPWSHLDFGVDRRFLRDEYRRALAGEPSPDCRSGECTECGVCDVIEAEPALKGTWH
jgi:radical SAM family uncharacterized protein